MADSHTTDNDREAQHSSSSENLAINTHTPHSGQPQPSNPVLQLLRDQQLGKTVLTLVVPMTTGVLAIHNKDHSSGHFLSTVLSLSIGLTAVWNGMLLRNTFSGGVANAVEQFGAAAIFFSFFSVITSLLPPNLAWVPWTCFVAVLLSSILSCLPVTLIERLMSSRLIKIISDRIFSSMGEADHN